MASEIRELEAFARDAMLKGTSKQEIQSAMLRAGWAEAQAHGALSGWQENEFGVPVPVPRPSLSAREAFLYLVLFSTLYWSAYHLASLLFDFINQAFPDPSVRDNWRKPGDSMRWSIASLIIAFPVFLWISHYMRREVVKNPIKRLSPVRRWLTYLTLFLAVGILIGDVTTLIYNLLLGELTVRFGLKILVAALVSGCIFWYYLSDLRTDEQHDATK
jgi:hypothetical protein